MKESFISKVSNRYLEGKKAIVIGEINSIEKGSTVRITGKNSKNKLFLNIEQDGKTILGVNPEHLQLIHEPECWPVEMDTLDLREYKFN